MNKNKFLFALTTASIVLLASKAGYSDGLESSVIGKSAIEKEKSEAGSSDSADFPLLMRTIGERGAIVRRAMHKRSAALARVYPGAVMRMRRSGSSSSCPEGWMERMGGGYVCAGNLARTTEGKAGPSPVDAPDIFRGFEAVNLTVKGAKIFGRRKDFERKRAEISLLAGSKLIVGDKLERDGIEYFKTRKGSYIEASNLEKLPPPLGMIGVDVSAARQAPGAVVTSAGARVYGEPNELSEPISTIARWTAVPAQDGELSIEGDGWVKIGPGKFVRDAEIARFRKAPSPRELLSEERWIAVDLKEQLLHAYEGETPVRIMPCSTGRTGNTKPGHYRVQWKRRVQTMSMKNGRLLIEDVQWVMYYDRKDGIAIHSAYWHQDFGTPVSHGCVNLTIPDARWLFEWSTPWVLPEDSERFPSPGQPGSRVVVFK